MRRRTLPPIAPLYIFVITYPIMWALGLAYFVWPLGALFFGLPLLLNRPVRVPPGTAAGDEDSSRWSEFDADVQG